MPGPGWRDRGRGQESRHYGKVIARLKPVTASAAKPDSAKCASRSASGTGRSDATEAVTPVAVFAGEQGNDKAVRVFALSPLRTLRGSLAARLAGDERAEVSGAGAARSRHGVAT